MFIDLQATFSGSTTVAGVKTGDAVTVTAISANVLDLRNQATPALGDEGLNPNESWLLVMSTTTFTAAGAATLTTTLESDTVAALNSTPKVHFATAAIPLNAAVAGNLIAGFSIIRTALPSDNYQRFLGLRYTVATGPMTAGNVLAWLSPDIQRSTIYPAGYTIDV